MGFGTPRGTIKKDEVILLNIVFRRKTFKIKVYLSPSLQSVTFLLKQGTLGRGGSSQKDKVLVPKSMSDRKIFKIKAIFAV